MYRVLVIGYTIKEYENIREEYSRHDIILDFTDSPSQAKKLLDNRQYRWAIFHLRALENLQYIDIMRCIKSVPIFILPMDGINSEQIKTVPNCVLELDKEQKTSEQLSRMYLHGDLCFCQEQHIVRVCGQEINLTAKEFDILALLISNPNRVFTYEMIIELVWKDDYSFYSRKTVSNHVGSLRRKLKVKSDSPDYIKSVHGVGYKFIE